MDVLSYLLGKKASGGGGGSSDLDWTALGYEERPQAIDEGYNYALEIKNNWVSPGSMTNKFSYNHQLMFMPLVDTSIAISFSSAFRECFALEKVALLDTSYAQSMQATFYSCYSLLGVPLFNTIKIETMQQMFYFCENLKNVPRFNTSALKGSNAFKSMFSGCLKLTDESLNNILEMCINATNYTGTKTLYELGISDRAVYPISRIEALSKYQDFIDAGWTITT